jgi:uncharacterized membrane protein YjfL (UPF0719 family)
MKKIFLILFLVSFVFAQDLGFPSRNLPPVINCGQDFFQCLGFFFAKILRVIIVLALVLSTIFIGWAGILYITKGGRKEDIKKIHQKLIWAAIGLIVAFLAFAFVKFLEVWMIKGQVYFLSIVYAQIEEPRAPTSLKCGNVSLPSALEGGNLSHDIWKACILFYAQKILSFLYVLALMLGVIFLSWTGILYITQPEKSKDIHQRLIFGIVGIIIAILSFTIVKIIDLFFTKL